MSRLGLLGCTIIYIIKNKKDAKNAAAGSLTELSKKFISLPLVVFFSNASEGDDSSNSSRFGGPK